MSEDESVVNPGNETGPETAVSGSTTPGSPLPDSTVPGSTTPGSAVPEEPGPSFVRRLLRSRTTRAVAVAALAGALVGAGAVAWRTDTLPLLGPAPCWDSLGDSTMSELFGDRRTEVEEQSLRSDPQGDRLAYGQCRITSYKDDRARRQVTLKVHRLDGLRGTDAQQWPKEFLAAGMVPLGDGLPGMASGSRAWLALPQSCTGRSEFSGPTVVDIGMGRADLDISSKYEREDRAALTGALVEAANGVIRSFDCSGVYPAPRTPLLSAPTWRNAEANAFCGIKGFALPAAYREDLAQVRAGAEGGPARVCEAGSTDREASLRLTTVVDPALTEIYSWDVLRSGAPVKGDKGYGKTGGNRAVFRADCQTGPVVFVAEQLRQTGEGDFTLTRDLLPDYAAAEADRIGCGPLKLTFPKG